MPALAAATDTFVCFGADIYIYMHIYNICIIVVLRPSCFIVFLRGLLLPQNVVSVYVPLIFV